MKERALYTLEQMVKSTGASGKADKEWSLLTQSGQVALSCCLLARQDFAYVCLLNSIGHVVKCIYATSNVLFGSKPALVNQMQHAEFY